MKKNKTLAIAVIILQVLFLSAMIVFHAYRLNSSVRILLKTVPYDPMSIFRGAYASLRYEISNIPAGLLKDANYKGIKGGDEVVVRLKKSGDYWVADEVYKKRPKHDTGLFIRGRLEHYQYIHSEKDNMRIDYGIESYFLSEKKAKDVDRVNIGSTWQEQERRRKELYSKLDEETGRIRQAGVSDWWLKILDKEMGYWVKQGIISSQAEQAIHDKYESALAKVKDIDSMVSSSGRDNSQPIIVEVAIDKDGNGLPTKLIVQGREYR